MPSNRLLIIGSLLALYLIWGAAYLVVRIGLDDWPPLMLSGIRFLLAGGLMLSWLRWRGAKWPTRPQMLGTLCLGLLIPAAGNGLVTVAQREISSGTTAIVVALIPLFTTFLSWCWGDPVRIREWVALVLGVLGMLILSAGENLSANVTSTVILIIGCLAWSVGSVVSKRVAQPTGLMACAMMLLWGGMALMLASVFRGERLLHWPSASGWAALWVLVIFCSVIAYSAYIYLLDHVRPGMATSFAFVNPVIAMLLGVAYLGEHLGRAEWTGILVIILAVLMLP